MTGNNELLSPDERRKNVQRYLEQGFLLNDQVLAVQSQWNHLTDRAFSLRSPSDLSGVKVQTSSPREASYAKPMESRSELEKTLCQTIQRLNALKEQMILLINQYTIGTENLILTRRYLDCLKVSEIAEELHYTSRQIKRLTDKAMEKIVLPVDAIWL